MNKPVLIIGGGGHAKVLINCLLLNRVNILGIFEADTSRVGQEILGVSIIGSDDAVFQYNPSEVSLVNAIGSTKSLALRTNIFNKFKNRGYSFSSVTHPSAVVAADVVAGEGVQIMAGAIIQPGCCLGNNVIINTKASIDHDCKLEEHVHVAPGTTVSGGVVIGAGSHIGTGTVIIQNLIIGKNSTTGAGAIVVNNVPNDVVVVGGPARVITQ